MLDTIIVDTYERSTYLPSNTSLILLILFYGQVTDKNIYPCKIKDFVDLLEGSWRQYSDDEVDSLVTYPLSLIENQIEYYRSEGDLSKLKSSIRFQDSTID